MKSCYNFNKLDPRSVHRIFVLLQDSTIELTVFHFNTFFNYIIDSPLLCCRYFNEMTKKRLLVPNIATFNALIKGCLSQSRYRLATKYWYLMKDKYKIQPNNLIYQDMISIYSKSDKLDRIDKLFTEYLMKLNKQELRADARTFRCYFRAFSFRGDTKKMKSILKVMNEYKVSPNSLISDIMNGYLNANKPQKSIEIFNKYINKPEMSDNMTSLFIMKCKALNQMIKNESHFDTKQELYKELENLIFHQYKDYGIKILDGHIAIILEAVINVYNERDPDKIMHVFKSFKDKNLICYKSYEKDKDCNALDLHPLRNWNVQKFVLRYVIEKELNEFISLNGTLHIIVGKGIHSIGEKNRKRLRIREKMIECGSLSQGVIEELLSYKPPIRCKYDENNVGVLLIEPSQLTAYHMALFTTKSHMC